VKSNAWSLPGLKLVYAKMAPVQTNLTPTDPQAGNEDHPPPDQDHQPTGQAPSTWLKLFALLCSVGLMGIGLWLQRQEWSKTLNWVPWGVLIAGFLLFIVGQRINPEKQLPSRISKPLHWLMTRLQLNGWQLVCLVISPLLALVAFWAAGTGPYMNNPVVSITSWVLAILLAIMGGLLNLFPISFNFPKQDFIIIGLLVLIAGLIRGLYINYIPIVLSGDEASSGISAVAFIDGFTDNIFRMGWYSFPAFHNWLQSIPIRLFGQNIPALRFSSIFAGSVTVGVIYVVAKALFGQRVGLYSAIFLSAYHFHHNFSRIGLNNIWDGLWFLSVLGALWFGLHRGKRWAFIISGLALGFSQYFYVTSRLLLALVPAWLLIIFLFDRSRFKKLWPDILLLGITATVVVIPLAGYYIQNPSEYLAPLVRVSIMDDWLVHEMGKVGKPGWLILLQQLGLSFLGLVNVPLRAWYTPGVPLLRLPSAILFLVGLGVLILKPKDNRFHLLALWITAICIPGGLSESVPAAQRYVALAPALAIMVGFGLDEIAVQLGQLIKRFKGIINLAALLAIIILSVGELNFYFFVYTPKSEFGGANSLVAQRLADTLQDKSPDWEVLFWGYPRMGYYSIPSLQYLVPEINGLDMNAPWRSSQNPQPTSDHLIFVFLPDHEHQIPDVQADYPGGNLIQEFDRSGRSLYWLYEVAPETQSNLPINPQSTGILVY